MQQNSEFLATDPPKPSVKESIETKQEERKKNFRKDFDITDNKRKHEEQLNTMRKKQREQQFEKKRQHGITSENKPDIVSTDAEVQKQLEQVQNMKFSEENIPALCAELNSDDEIKQYFAAIGFRKLLALEDNPPIQKIIDSNVVPRLIEFLKLKDKPHLQYESAWALTNIASGEEEYTQVLVEKGAIPVFIDMLGSQTEQVKEQAVWALGNIAGDNITARNIVLAAGALDPLLKILVETKSESMIRNGSWALSNFIRGKPAPKVGYILKSIPIFAKLLKENVRIEVLIDVCWALSYISDGAEKTVPSLIKADVIPRIVELLEHQVIAISIPCIRVLGNIITGDDEDTDKILAAGALKPLEALLSHPKRPVRKEACWAISNIAAGNPNQIKQVIENPTIFSKIVKIIEKDDIEVKKEAIWAISNLTSNATNEQIQSLVNMGMLEVLSKCLKFTEPRQIAVALEGLDNVLKVGQTISQEQNPYVILFEGCEGITILEELQTHPNQSIYEKALYILEKYIGEEEDENMIENSVSTKTPESDDVRMQFNF